MQPGVTTESTALDNLYAGEFPRQSESVVILAGQDLTIGAAIGQITASGKWVLSLAAAGDGSEVIRGVLVEDVDATAADVTSVAMVSGGFNQNAMTFGAGHDPATVATQQALADLNIYLVDSIAQ